ncbi:MAG: hypothetical protein VKJ04_05480 [Vampirovibrionales bacterium]|nr:hypothetical protein [Vampirovibrionales bacterium]
MMTLSPSAAKLTKGTEAPSLNPRDIQTLQAWKLLGLELLSLTVSQVSPLRGLLAENAPLPANTRIACIVREGDVLFSLYRTFIEEGDVLYILTDNERGLRDYLIA